VHIRRFAPLAVVFALAACGQSAGNLQSYLHDQHQYDQSYGVLKGATYTDKDNRIVVKTRALTEATAAQDVCGWVSEWLYGNGDDGSIKVLNRDGDVLSQRRAKTDSCSFG